MLDGIDLDLEQTPSACNAPSSDACTQVVEGWFHFVRRLRSLMDADTRKEYLLTAVPINTKYGDPSAGGFGGWGALTHGHLPGISRCDASFEACTPTCPPGGAADAALRAQPARSVFTAFHLLDFVWPQFYPAPVSITMNGEYLLDDLTSLLTSRSR